MEFLVPAHAYCCLLLHPQLQLLRLLPHSVVWWGPPTSSTLSLGTFPPPPFPHLPSRHSHVKGRPRTS
jgi:hypothetical protein